MKTQRLRNLTTGRLHTQMDDIYEDVEYLTGEQGVMTHMLPRAAEALEPYIRAHVPDPRFWDGKFDLSHVGDVDIPPMGKQDRAAFWKRYAALPNPLERLERETA